MDADLQSIQSSLNDKMNQAKTLIRKIDNTKESNINKFSGAMASLRRTIDEHERAVLDQSLSIETDQKKQIEEYQNSLQHEQQGLDVQKSNFTIILSVKDHTKLLQAKQGFVDYLYRTNVALDGLQSPTLTDYRIEGLYELPTLEEKIHQCGRLGQTSTYSNPQLQTIIAENGTNTTLKLDNQRLTDQDMEIVADALRKTMVRKHCFTNFLLLSQTQSI
jgi:hypothetical protein